MNSFRVRIFLCCVPAIFATGCPSAPSDPCAEVTCDANEVCVDGTCETVCNDDDDCAPGETCFNGVCAVNCIANDSCACDSDADCNDQDACTTDDCLAQICFNTPISCNTVDTCPAGCNVSCNFLSFCSNSIDPCSLCDADQICIFGVCVECGSDADCDDGNVCSSNGDCVECVGDGHCDGGVCDEAANTCVECIVNDDCNDFPNNPCIANICDGEECTYLRIFCPVLAPPCPAGCECVETAGTRACLAPDEID